LPSGVVSLTVQHWVRAADIGDLCFLAHESAGRSLTYVRDFWWGSGVSNCGLKTNWH
jgi:hypothetical protein